MSTALTRTRETAASKAKPTLIAKSIVTAKKSTNSSSPLVGKKVETVLKELAVKNKSSVPVQTRINPMKTKIGPESNKITSKRSTTSVSSAVGSAVTTSTPVKRVAADSTVKTPLKVAVTVKKPVTTASKAAVPGLVKKPIVAAKTIATTTKISTGTLKNASSTRTTMSRTTSIATKPSPTTIIAKGIKSSPSATAIVKRVPPSKTTIAEKKPTVTKRGGALPSLKTSTPTSKPKENGTKTNLTQCNESKRNDQTATTELSNVQIRPADSTSDTNSENCATDTIVATPDLDESRMIKVAEQLIEARIKYQLGGDDATADQNQCENEEVNAEESSSLIFKQQEHQSDGSLADRHQTRIEIEQQVAHENELLEGDDENECLLKTATSGSNDDECRQPNETTDMSNEADRCQDESQPIEQVKDMAADEICQTTNPPTDSDTPNEGSDPFNDAESSFVENDRESETRQFCGENDDNTNEVETAIDAKNDDSSYKNGLEMREDYFGEGTETMLQHESLPSLPSIVDDFEMVNESYDGQVVSSEEDGTNANAASDKRPDENTTESTVTSAATDCDIVLLEQQTTVPEINVDLISFEVSTSTTMPFQTQAEGEIVSELDTNAQVANDRHITVLVNSGDQNEEKPVKFTIPENELCSDDTLLENSIDASVNEQAIANDEDAIKTTRKNKRNKKQRRNRRGSRYTLQDGDDGAGNAHQSYEPQPLANEMVCAAADYEFENGPHFKKRNSKRRNSMKKYNNYASGRSGAVDIEHYADSNGYYTNKMWRDVATHDYYS